MDISKTTKNTCGVPDNFRNFFIIVFDKPFDYTASVTGGGIIDRGSLEASDNHAGAIIGFRTTRGERVHARVASSFISHEQAERNLQELGVAGFDEVVYEGRKIWNDILAR